MPRPSRSPSLRSDAAANRERILQTAALVVNRRGPQVPMVQFAKAAGVGVGTLYRHFPSREDLIGALQYRALEHVRDAAREAAGLDLPATDAMARFFRGVISRRDELVLPLNGGPALVDPALATLQAEVRASIRSILDRGQARGTIRAEVSSFDVIVIGAMLSQPLPLIDDWEEVAQRLARVFLRGLTCQDDASES